MRLYVSSCTKLFFSDDFIQAQPQLARWASEDVVSVVVMESDSSAVDPSPVITVQKTILPNITSQMGNGLGVTASRTDYYPSPPSTTETESSGSVMPHQQQLQQQRPGIIDVNGGPQENTGRYPEYKH